MASRTRRRVPRCRYESLERRELLAGNVTAAVANGQLSILGDQAANGLTVVQLPDTVQPGAPPSGNLLLKPDASTRLNGQAPGVGLTLSGVTGGVSLSLGTGADTLSWTGRADSSLTSLLLDTGGGSDNVVIKGQKILQNVAVLSTGGNDVVRISGSTFEGDVDFEMTGNPDVSMSSGFASSVYWKVDAATPGDPAAYLKIKLTDVLVTGVMSVESSSSVDVSVDGGQIGSMLLHKEWLAPSAAGVVSQSYLKLTNAVVLDAVDVDIEGGSVDFTSQGSQTGAVYIKLGEVEGEAEQLARVTLADGEVDGPLSLATDGSVDFSSSRMDHKDWILLESASSTTPPLEEVSFVFHTIKFVDTLVSSFVSVDTRGSSLDFSAQGSHLAAIYMKYDGVDGDVTSPPATARVSLADGSVDGPLSLSTDVAVDVSSARQTHKEWILVESVSFGTGRSAAAHKVEFVDTLISSYVDVDVEGVALDFTSQGTQSSAVYIKLSGLEGEVPPLARVTLADGEVGPLSLVTDGSVDFSSSRMDHKDWILLESASSAEPPLEEVAFYYNRISFDHSQVSNFVSVETRGSAFDFTSQGSQLAAGYLKIGDIKGEAAAPPATARVSLVDGSVDGPFSLSTDMAVDFSSVRHKHKDWIELESSSLDSARSAAAHKVEFIDTQVSSYVDVDVDGAGTLDVAAQNLDAQAMYLKFDGVEGASERSLGVSLAGTSISEQLLVDTQGSLALQCASGEHIKKATLFVRKQGTDQQDYYKVTLSDLLVSSFSVGDDAVQGVQVAVQGGSAESVAVEGRGSPGTPSVYYKVTLEDCLVSSYSAVDVDGDVELSVDSSSLASLSVHSGGDRPMESLSLNFTKVEMKYHEQGERSVSLTGGSVGSVSMEMSGRLPGTAPQLMQVTFTDLLVSSFASVNLVDFLDDDVYSVVATNSEMGGLDVSSSRGSGGGVGKVSLQDFHFSKVSVQDNGASVAVDVGGGQGSGLSIKHDGSPVAGKEEQFYTIELSNGRIGVVDIDVTGDVDLSVDGSSLASLSVHSGSDRPMESLSLNFAKVEMKYHEQGERSLSLSGGSLGSLLVVDNHSPVPGDASFLQVTLEDCLVSSYSSVQAAGGLEFTATNGAIGQLSLSAGGGGGGGGLATESLSLNFTKVEFSYKPVSNNRTITIDGAHTEHVSISGSDPDLTSPPQVYQIKLTDVLVSSYSSIDVEDLQQGDLLDLQMENVAAPIFEVTSAKSSGSGGGAGKASFSDLSVISVRLLDDGQLATVEMQGGQAGGASFARRAGGKEPTEYLKIKMSDLLVSSFVDVDVDDASTSLEMSRSSAGGVRVAVGDVNGDGHPDLMQVKLTDVLISGIADFNSDGIADLVVARSRLGSLSVDAAGGSSATGVPNPGSQVMVSTSRVLGRTTIDLGGGADVVLLSRAIFSGSTSMSMGSGDDRLTAVDSWFSRFALLDGGEGGDTLTLTRTRFIQSPFLRNWEPPGT